MIAVVTLVARAAVVEVVGHARVGFSHTVRVVEADLAQSDPHRAPGRAGRR